MDESIVHKHEPVGDFQTCNWVPVTMMPKNDETYYISKVTIHKSELVT